MRSRVVFFLVVYLLLAIASLCVTLVAVIEPHWVEGPNSTSLGLFLYCKMNQCESFPETMQSAARKGAAGLFVTGTVLQIILFCTLVYYFCTFKESCIYVLLLGRFLASGFFIAAVIVYYKFGLEGLSGDWTQGICYYCAIASIALAILLFLATLILLKLSAATHRFTFQRRNNRSNFNETALQPRQRAVSFIRLPRNISGVVQSGLPTEWEPMGNETIKIVEIRGQEYRTVMTKFSATLPKRVEKIERVQNPMLYKQFSALKETVKTRLQNAGCSHLIMTNLLFHGTSYDSVQNICKDGFDRSHCGKNGTVFGKGVYFAKKASYSHNYAAASGHAGLRRMILAEVTTGYYTLGNSNMNVVPIKPNGDPYDSVVNKINNPEVYVVFKDASAYPSYIITYN